MLQSKLPMGRKLRSTIAAVIEHPNVFQSKLPMGMKLRSTICHRASECAAI